MRRLHVVAYLCVAIVLGFVLVLVWYYTFANSTSKRGKTPMDESSHAGLKAIVDEYVAKNKGWTQEEYSIQYTDRQAPGGEWIVNVVHRDDYKQGVPGGGKSVQLHIDLGRGVVTRELWFQ